MIKHLYLERVGMASIHSMAMLIALSFAPLLYAAPEIDFSTCGYRHSNEPIPIVPIRAVVTPSGRGDDHGHIQAAIDYVSELEPDAVGFRGAVLLEAGHFIVRESLELRASGVVLRGSGVDKTVLRGDCLSRAALIRVFGRADMRIHQENAKQVVDKMVPAGANPTHARRH